MKFRLRLKKVETGWEYVLQNDEPVYRTLDSGILKTKEQAIEEAKYSKKMFLESEDKKQIEIEMVEDF